MRYTYPTYPTKLHEYHCVHKVNVYKQLQRFGLVIKRQVLNPREPGFKPR